MTIAIEPGRPINFSDIVNISEGTRPSINLARDKDDNKKVEGYIPTPTAMELLTQLAAAVSGSNTNGRVRYLYGPYGGGKSHLALVLQHLVRFGPESPAMTPIWTKLRGMGQSGQRLVQTIFDTWGKISTNKGFFPVLLQANDGPFRQAMLSALNRELNKVFKGDVFKVQPSSIYQAALEQLEIWRTAHPDLYNKVQQETKDVETIISGLRGFKHEAYVRFCEAYARATGGGSFDPGSWAKTFEVYAEVAKNLHQFGYQGIYIIHDEFGDYLNQAIRDDVDGYTVTGPRSRGDGIEFQEFAEMCVESGEAQVHFLMCSHLDIAGYAERTRADKDVKEAWQKYYGRAAQTLITSLGGDKEVFQLIDGVIVQEHDKWQSFVQSGAKPRLVEASREARKHEFFPAKDWDISKIEEDIVQGCYPLHPVTLYALPRLSVLLGQNERTMFTFISGTDAGTLGAYLREHSAFLPSQAPMLPVDYIFEYFEPSLKPTLKDWYNRTVYSSGGASAPSLDIRLLKVLTLWQVMLAGVVIPLTQKRIAFALDLPAEDFEDLDQSVRRLEEKEIIYISRDGTLHVYGDKSNLENEIKEKIDLLKPTHRPGDFLRRKNGTLMSPTLRIEDVCPVAYIRKFGVNRCFKADYYAPGDYQQQILRGGGKRGINPWQQLLAPLKDEADGLVLYALPQSRQELEALIKTVSVNGQLVNPRVIIIVPARELSISEYTLKLEAIITLLGETEISQTERRNILLKKQADLIQELETVLNPVLQFSEGGRGAEAYCGGVRLIPSFNSPADLEDRIDAILTQTFKFEVPVRDESFAQRRAAPTTSKLQKNIIRDILKFDALTESDKPSFGYAETSAERRMIRSVLRAHEILKLQNGKWQLSAPTIEREKNLAVIMKMITDFFFSQDGERKPIKKLLKLLLEPPYGIFETVLPIYIAAAIYKQAWQLTFYYKNAPAKSDPATIVQDLIDDYEDYEVCWHGVKPEDRAFMQVILQSLDAKLPSEELNVEKVIERLAQRFNNLPVLVRETNLLPDGIRNFRNLLKLISAEQVAPEEVLSRLAAVLEYSELVNNSGGQISRLIPAKEKLQNYLIYFNKIAAIQHQKLAELLGQKIKELPEIGDEENLTLALHFYLENRDPQDISRYAVQFPVISQLKQAVTKGYSISSVLDIIASGWYEKPITEWNDHLIELFQNRLNNLFQVLGLMQSRAEKVFKDQDEPNDFNKGSGSKEIDPRMPAPALPARVPNPYLKPQFITTLLEAIALDRSDQEASPALIKHELSAYFQKLPEYVKNTNHLTSELNNLRVTLRQAANNSTSPEQVLSRLWNFLELPREVTEDILNSSQLTEACTRLNKQLERLKELLGRLIEDADKVLYDALVQVLGKEPEGGHNDIIAETAKFFQGRDQSRLAQLLTFNLEGMSAIYQASQSGQSFSDFAANLQVILVGVPLENWNDENFQQFKGKVQALTGNLKNIPVKSKKSSDKVRLTMGLDNNIVYFDAQPCTLSHEQEVALGKEIINLLRKHNLVNAKGLHFLTKTIQVFIKVLDKERQ